MGSTNKKGKERPMAYRCVIVLILAATLASCSSTPATQPAADTARMPVQAAPEAYSAGIAGATDSSQVPEMERGRKINEQDCTKSIDFKAGNLMCK